MKAYLDLMRAVLKTIEQALVPKAFLATKCALT